VEERNVRRRFWPGVWRWRWDGSSAATLALEAGCGTLDSMLFEATSDVRNLPETEYGSVPVVYFTELEDHNKESEINHALAASTFTTVLSAITARKTPSRSSAESWNV